MSFLTKLLVQNASSRQLFALKNIPLSARPVFCLYRLSGSVVSTASFGNLGCTKLNYYSTGPGHKKPTKKNYYRVLGVSPKATQAQIKTAFYKLSLKHHPDKHKGSEESHDRFQEISEAYNVLSDHEQRKLYDRELVVDGQLRAEHAHAYYPPKSPKKPRESIYDFDEWTKAHYSKQLNQNQQARTQKAEDRVELNKPKMRIGSFRMIILGATVIVGVISYYIHLKRLEEDAKKYE